MFRTLFLRGQQKNYGTSNKVNVNDKLQRFNSNKSQAKFPSKSLERVTHIIKAAPKINVTENYFYFSTKKEDYNKSFSYFDKFKNLMSNNPFSIKTLPNNPSESNTKALTKTQQSTIKTSSGTTNHFVIQKDIQGFKQEIIRALQLNEKSTEQVQQLLEKIERELEKQTSHNYEFSHAQVELLQKLVKDLCYLTREIVISRGTSTEDMQKLETISKEEMEKLIQKMDEAANSRLTSFAAYATILSLIVAIIIFAYQENQSKEKEKETRAAVAEKLRVRNEETLKKIDKIDLTYRGLIDRKNGLEKAIEKLRSKKQKTKELRSARWLFTSDLDLYLVQIKQDIEHKKEELELINKEINKWELFVLKKRTIEDSEFERVNQEKTNNKPADEQDNNNRPRVGF